MSDILEQIRNELDKLDLPDWDTPISRNLVRALRIEAGCRVDLAGQAYARPADRMGDGMTGAVARQSLSTWPSRSSQTSRA